MSCIHCGNKKEGDIPSPNCLCDQFVHPLPLHIGAGLNHLPRQIASFPEFRRAMLYLLQTEQVQFIDTNNNLVNSKPLANWRARGKDDLGLMLLEMWAYVCDVLSFYDEAIANESYIRTSQLRPDIRRLVALLGYRPRPAVGSSVQLAALADRRLPLKLPVGTAFRSGAFNGNPPQVFELDQEVIIHPLTNKWKILPPHPGIIQQNFPSQLTIAPTYDIKEGAVVLLVDAANQNQNTGGKVQQLEKYTGNDKKQYTRIGFTTATKLSAGTQLNTLKIFIPTQTARLWTLNSSSDSVTTNMLFLGNKSSLVNATLKNYYVVGSYNTLVLENQIPQLKANEYILVTYDNEVRWFKIKQVKDVSRQPMASSDMTINGHKYQLPGMSISVTEITLDANLNDAGRKQSGLNWDNNIREGITVHFAMQTAARVIDEPKSGVSSSDPLYFDGFVEKPVDEITATNFLLQDVNTRGAAVEGAVNFTEKKLTLSQGVSWAPELQSPVTVYGNVITARRGEKVVNEKMGSGNASLVNQTFKLKKKPLTYYLSPTAENDNGVKNTLIIHVNGVQWTEVNSFYGRKENEQIYIVRQNDEGDTMITFGDGIRGQRLPSGVDNVIAEYHFGAEAACPPAGAVNQISKPVKGLQSVKNMLAAFGGADAEPASDIKKNAPRSALILGRVVSLKDMEAVAASFPGIKAVQADWRWNKQKQTASAHIFYIGDDGLQAALSQRLRNLSDPSVSITVEKAKPVPLHLSLTVRIDNRYLEADVIQQLRLALTNTGTGMLAAQNIGIGQPLFQSRLFEAILSVKGTVAVDGILLNRKNFGKYAVTPGAGRYFNLGDNDLTINGTIN
jgi:hypothetical protein